ncbi:MAG: 50S ribosomal protein L20 [Christensenellales bacterium]
MNHGKIKGAVNAHRRRKIMKLAKGYYGSSPSSIAEAGYALLRYAYIGRKLRKRDYRSCGSPVSTPRPASTACLFKFICGLKKAGVDLNRKVLADLAERAAANQARRSCQNTPVPPFEESVFAGSLFQLGAGISKHKGAEGMEILCRAVFVPLAVVLLVLAFHDGARGGAESSRNRAANED